MDKYAQMKAQEKVDTSDKTVLAKLAKEDSPAAREVIQLLRNPYFMALVKLIELYNKFNEDHDVEELSKIYTDHAEFAANDETVIVILKQLLKEFGCGLLAVVEDKKDAKITTLAESQRGERIAEIAKESLAEKLRKAQELVRTG